MKVAVREKFSDLKKTEDGKLFQYHFIGIVVLKIEFLQFGQSKSGAKAVIQLSLSLSLHLRSAKQVLEKITLGREPEVRGHSLLGSGHASLCKILKYNY